MPITKITIPDFINNYQHLPVFDVRSDGEYNYAHIPHAFSLPIFNDEERKVVGTEYKQINKQQAIKTGLDFFGKKMVSLVECAERHLENKSKEIVVHCWRGGMRSAAVAWLLDLYGFKVFVLIGGYKAYRNWAIQQLEKPAAIHILGGYTGSGKTYILEALKQSGKPVIDIEDLANHKGSAFGMLGMPPQPSQEMFENLLAYELDKINTTNTSSAIWIEDESQRIGNLNIPTPFFHQMRQAKIYFIDIPFEERLQHIISGYGQFDVASLSESIIRITKRLGGLETKNALNFLQQGNIKDCFAILLHYYDKYYLKGLQKRKNYKEMLTIIESDKVAHQKNADKITVIVKVPA